jgi:hypothetical protein
MLVWQRRTASAIGNQLSIGRNEPKWIFSYQVQIIQKQLLEHRLNIFTFCEDKDGFD